MYKSPTKTPGSFKILVRVQKEGHTLSGTLVVDLVTRKERGDVTSG